MILNMRTWEPEIIFCLSGLTVQLFFLRHSPPPIGLQVHSARWGEGKGPSTLLVPPAGLGGGVLNHPKRLCSDIIAISDCAYTKLLSLPLPSLCFSFCVFVGQSVCWQPKARLLLSNDKFAGSFRRTQPKERNVLKGILFVFNPYGSLAYFWTTAVLNVWLCYFCEGKTSSYHIIVVLPKKSNKIMILIMRVMFITTMTTKIRRDKEMMMLMVVVMMKMFSMMMMMLNVAAVVLRMLTTKIAFTTAFEGLVGSIYCMQNLELDPFGVTSLLIFSVFFSAWCDSPSSSKVRRCGCWKVLIHSKAIQPNPSLPQQKIPLNPTGAIQDKTGTRCPCVFEFRSQGGIWRDLHRNVYTPLISRYPEC